RPLSLSRNSPSTGLIKNQTPHGFPERQQSSSRASEGNSSWVHMPWPCELKTSKIRIFSPGLYKECRKLAGVRFQGQIGDRSASHPASTPSKRAAIFLSFTGSNSAFGLGPRRGRRRKNCHGCPGE